MTAFTGCQKTNPVALPPGQCYYRRMKRIQIITGAGTGIGREFACQLARTRPVDELWLIGRRIDKLDETARLVANQVDTAPHCRTIAMDIGGPQGVAAVTQLLAAEKDIIIDTLVNNAGFGTYGTFMKTPLDRELEMIHLNIYTLTALCHLCIPRMGPGSLLVNVASLAAFIPLGNFAVYAATKAYALSFSVALGAEIADSGIFVSSLCPGPVDTEFANVASGGVRKKVAGGKSAEQVVSCCLKDAARGTHISLATPLWKFKAFMSRFVGRYAYARHSYKHDTRPAPDSTGQ